MYQRVLAILLALLASAAALADDVPHTPALTISAAYVRAMPAGQTTGAAFMRIDNHGDRAQVLSSASSPAAARVEIHTHLHEDGMMRMRRLESVTVSAKDHLTFAPGGLHLMLIGLRRPLVAGEHITVELHFADGEALPVVVPVTSLFKEPS